MAGHDEHMLHKRILSALAVAAISTGGYAFAQSAIPQMKTSVDEGQKAVATLFTEDSVGDVQLGRLGLQKSKNAAVRELARALVRDHTKTADEGMRVAQNLGDSDVKWKAGDSNQIELTRLNRFSGSQFDREYVKTLIQAHQTDIGTVKDSLEFSSAPALKTYLQDLLRVDQRHLQMAQADQAKL